MTPDTSFRNRNAVWCTVLAGALWRHGVRSAVLCMGGRSAQMGAVLNAWPGMDTLCCTDERAGAFYALGRAKRSGRPALICTTSGSAVANALPALAEAQACGTPLILLSCDRPRTVRTAGAPQCLDQVALCAALVDGAIDLPDPGIAPADLQWLQDAIARLLAGPPGPIHINLPQHGWLASTDPEPDLPPPVLPPLLNCSDTAPAAGASLPGLPSGLPRARAIKGLIFVGPDAPLPAADIAVFARATGYPVLADFPSNLRRPHTIPALITNGDLLLTGAAMAACRPEFLIRFGAAPVSSLVQRYLQLQHCPVVLLARRDGPDFLHPDATRMVAPNPATLVALAAALGPGDPDWRGRWLAQAARAQRFQDDVVAGLPWGECQAAAMICNAPGYLLFHAANSMAIRHANQYCTARDSAQFALANRGVSGIDGTLATFIGAIDAEQAAPSLLLIGDQAFAHDVGALQLARGRPLRGAICVMNNGGGAIFDMLSCAGVPDYTRLMRADPGNRIDLLATAFGLRYRACGDALSLAAALADGAVDDGLSIVEVCVPHASLQRDIGVAYAGLNQVLDP